MNESTKRAWRTEAHTKRTLAGVSDLFERDEAGGYVAEAEPAKIGEAFDRIARGYPRSARGVCLERVRPGDGGRLSMHSANLALRFLLELAALAAVAYAGYRAADAAWLRWALAAAAPLAFAAVWGTFVSPRASQRLRDPARLVLEGVLFGAAAVALGLVGLTGVAVLLAVFAAGNLALMFYFSQRGL